MNINKCPKCDKQINNVDAEKVEIVMSLKDKYHGYSYSCPHCRSVLSIEMSPLTLRDDISTQLRKDLGQIVERLETDIPKKILREIERMLKRLE